VGTLSCDGFALLDFGQRTGLARSTTALGSIVPLVVTIPTAKGGTPPSAPTGTVFNFTTGFNVVQGVPAVFIFVTENGTIAALESHG